MSEELTDRILKWAEECPEKCAVMDRDSSISYRELASAIKKEAHDLENGPQSDADLPVIVDMEKSARVPAILLGINLAGKSYCVFDKRLPSSQKDELSRRLQEGDDFPKDLQYITFTSGSTGSPKLIQTSRQAVMGYLASLTKALPYTKDLVIANQSPFSFDAYLKDVFAAFYIGATVCLTDRTMFMNPDGLISFLLSHGVNALTWTSSAYGILYNLLGGEDIGDKHFCENVRLITFGSERMSPEVLKWLIRNFPNAKIYQLYGPTEATGMSTYFKVDRNLKCLTDDGLIPIGRPLPGVSIILMDDNKASDKGEIYISSNRLSYGYYGDKELTESSFVNIDGKRYFKTGDIGKYGREGNLLFLGRNDDIIKRGGYRISLGVMSAEAEKCEGVDSAETLYSEAKNKLLMFYTGKTEGKLIKAFLAKKYPAPALPGRIIRLDTFPLLSNGKIDRKALLSWKD